MSYFSSIKFSDDAISKTVSGALRVAQQTTLFDGKILNADDTDIFQNIGTGTGLFQNNTYNMSVSSGQYFIKQSKRYFPYFSGKPQIVEQTFEDFQTETNVIKRVGYYSSNAVAPFNSNFDGFFLEDDGTTKRIRSFNNGVETANIPFSSWANYLLVQNYDWSKFTVIFWEFLWLGGAIMNLWLDVPGQGFVLCHTFQHAGFGEGTIHLSPNQPCRYEIRSTTGAGSFRYICSQIATEGSINESGKSICIRNTGLTTVNTVGSYFMVLGIRKLASFRDTAIKINKIACTMGGTTDNGTLILMLNPTITGAAPVWTTSSSGRFEWAQKTNNNQLITVNTGRELYAIPVSASGGSEPLDQDFLVWLSILIDNTPEPIYLVYQPATSNQSIQAIMDLKEF